MRTDMNILTTTKDFESWVSRHTHLVKSQISDKHKQMAESPVQFLRGTFYRWTQFANQTAWNFGARSRGLGIVAVL
jgi:hypothetical protein